VYKLKRSTVTTGCEIPRRNLQGNCPGRVVPGGNIWNPADVMPPCRVFQSMGLDVREMSDRSVTLTRCAGKNFISHKLKFKLSRVTQYHQAGYLKE